MCWQTHSSVEVSIVVKDVHMLKPAVVVKTSNTWKLERWDWLMGTGSIP
jgi:hypothetical protein